MIKLPLLSYDRKKVKVPDKLERGIVTERQDEENNQTAIRRKISENNVHSFGGSFGLTSDDISYLDGQYIRVNKMLISTETTLRAGYEVRTTAFSQKPCSTKFLSMNCELLFF